MFDSWAILAWVRNEQPAAAHVRAMFMEQTHGRLDLAMSMINVGEVYYRLCRLQTAEFARSFVTSLERRLRFADVPNWLILEAAGHKSRHRISYADAFALATAIHENAPLVTGDPDFEPFRDGALVQVEWLR